MSDSAADNKAHCEHIMYVVVLTRSLTQEVSYDTQ